MARWCRVCETNKDESEFYRFYDGSGRLLHICKKCRLAQQKRYEQATEEHIYRRKRARREAIPAEIRRERDRERHRRGSKKRAAYQKKWREENKDRVSAHGKVARAIRAGKLVRPNKCERCGRSDMTIDAAHKDYSKPLEVMWLCKRCHRIVDNSPVFRVREFKDAD